MVTRPPAVMYLETNRSFLNHSFAPLAADDDLVGDLDEEGGDADGVVEVGGDVEDHLDGVEEAHDRGPHLPRVFQIDCVDVLLRCPEEFGIVDCLGQKKHSLLLSKLTMITSAKYPATRTSISCQTLSSLHLPAL